MSKRDGAGTEKPQLIFVDQLFGRDLRRDGWFVDEAFAGRGGRRSSLKSDERASEIGPDPAVIWALRNRRRG
ncbi:MAG: hypothetical protein CFH10_01555 [Alphaproteobacteria bacterium MarineAlpha4_Bin2]|nr:MAG: hypothetical protein CFH10_01555 [Alphaproteobacteria bacterium MarineAlpha4_Bin2]